MTSKNRTTVLSEEQVKLASQKLMALREEANRGFNLKQTVTTLREPIQACLDQGMDWEDITNAIMAAGDEDYQVSYKTVRSYFFELRDGERGKATRAKSQKSKTQKSKAQQEPEQSAEEVKGQGQVNASAPAVSQQKPGPVQARAEQSVNPVAQVPLFEEQAEQEQPMPDPTWPAPAQSGAGQQSVRPEVGRPEVRSR